MTGDPYRALEVVRDEAMLLKDRGCVEEYELARFLDALPRDAFLQGHLDDARSYLLEDPYAPWVLRDDVINVDAAVVDDNVVLVVTNHPCDSQLTLNNDVRDTALGVLRLVRAPMSAVSLLRDILAFAFDGEEYYAVGIVFGVDEDSGKLYAHPLPSSLASLTAVAMKNGYLDSRLLRTLMGFDLQPWEASGEVDEGVRVRVQGDLVVEVVEKCAENECVYSVLPAALKVLRDPGAAARVGGLLQRLALDLGFECRRVFEDPAALIEAIAGRVTVPRSYMEVLEPLLDDRLVGDLVPILNGSALYLELEGCRAKLKLSTSSPSAPLVIYEGLDYVRTVMVAMPLGERTLNHIVRRLLARAAVDAASALARFEAVINDSHRVYGYGVAAADTEIGTEELRLPTMHRRVFEALRIMETLSRENMFRGLAALVSAALFYARSGDLYAYVPDGRLEFSHPEHGETAIELGGPAVVRVTALNSVPRPRVDSAMDIEDLLEALFW